MSLDLTETPLLYTSGSQFPMQRSKLVSSVFAAHCCLPAAPAWLGAIHPHVDVHVQEDGAQAQSQDQHHSDTQLIRHDAVISDCPKVTCQPQPQVRREREDHQQDNKHVHQGRGEHVESMPPNVPHFLHHRDASPPAAGTSLQQERSLVLVGLPRRRASTAQTLEFGILLSNGGGDGEGGADSRFEHLGEGGKNSAVPASSSSTPRPNRQKRIPLPSFSPRTCLGRFAPQLPWGAGQSPAEAPAASPDASSLFLPPRLIPPSCICTATGASNCVGGIQSRAESLGFGAAGERVCGACASEAPTALPISRFVGSWERLRLSAASRESARASSFAPVLSPYWRSSSAMGGMTAASSVAHCVL
eukprot:scaffold3575_cov254-Pinguiococcus_pyrenoidosus.AAC.12